MIVEGRARFVVLAAMSLFYFLLMAGTFNALGVVLPLMVADMHMDWAAAGLGFTLLGLACGLGSLLPAILIRRIGVSLTVLFGAVVLAAGFACLAVAHDARLYHVGTTLMGIGFCFCGTVPGVHVISAIFDKRASSALGVYFTTGGLGSVAGPLLFYGIDRLSGEWRAFWVIGAVAALATGAFAAIVCAQPKVRHESGEAPIASPTLDHLDWSARDALRQPQFWMVVAAYTGCLLVNTTVHSFAVQHLSERGLSLGAAAGLISFAALIGAGASSLAGVAGERLSPRALTAISLGTLTLATAALAVPQSWATLAVYAIAMGAGLGFSYVSTAMLLLDWFGRRPNLELYSLMCMISTSAAIGPWLGGIARDRSGDFVGTFVMLAGIGLVLLIALVATRRPVRAGGYDLAAEPA